MKIKAFGMDIQVTEEAVFVNGKEVYNKIEHKHNFDFIDEMLSEISPLEMEKIEKDMMQDMHNYSSGSSLIKPKDESEKQRGITIINIDQAEQRMNVIGQNGNDGLHYEFWKESMIEQINRDLMDNNRNEGVWDTDN